MVSVTFTNTKSCSFFEALFYSNCMITNIRFLASRSKSGSFLFPLRQSHVFRFLFYKHVFSVVRSRSTVKST